MYEEMNLTVLNCARQIKAASSFYSFIFIKCFDPGQDLAVSGSFPGVSPEYTTDDGSKNTNTHTHTLGQFSVANPLTDYSLADYTQDLH